ncbi:MULTISPECIES: hypothetical protein [Gracilibacillus]|uniref:hypothetical protein n=1 Tax=Gracilibacillus TaxID=74385 RepID=UPI000824478C|nr:MULTISPECIES: hypothetical protein [Gracilibacillus]
MKKKYMVIIAFLVVVTISFFIVREWQGASLTETVKFEEQYQDFVVHIQVEPMSEGFMVLRSIQYLGDEDIVIYHRAPLTQVTIDQDNPVFTGSEVEKQLNSGGQYYPQEPLTFSSLKKGEHAIFIHTQFKLEGEQVNIKSEGELVFE